VRRFYKHETQERLKSFFFLEASYLFGNLKFDGNVVPYSEASFQLGAIFRAATPDIQLIRHFGLELGAGVFAPTNEFETRNFRPNISAGLLIFFDKKYTSTKRIFRQIVFVEKK